MTKMLELIGLEKEEHFQIEDFEIEDNFLKFESCHTEYWVNLNFIRKFRLWDVAPMDDEEC